MSECAKTGDLALGLARAAPDVTEETAERLDDGWTSRVFTGHGVACF